ncbi:hypothetical protein [Methylophaga thalassica]|uniref:hypothetical protein n=1 Tax=Methylophaga thalassica TaxID=40223 RepID=UPI002E7C52DA|nr:hypothetical protein [Methylophaga thalassica]WVI84753.1 hypothetical protein VSX76_13350 [Methylophaga thalassica]
MRKYIPLLLPCLLINTASAAEWVFNAQADPKFKYDDNELLREDKLDDFSLNIDPTLSLTRSLENSTSEVRLGYRISRYQDLKELDKENPFASFSTSYATERSTYGLNLNYAERESRDIAEEDTADFSNTSTTITKSISPSYSYRLTELDTISSSFSYQTRKQSDSGSNSNILGASSNLTDNETASLNLAWQHQYTERLNGGISFTYVNYQAESERLDNQYDSYSLGLTSEYQLSELWSVNGLLGARYLDSENNPVIGSKTSDQSTGLNYSISTTREDELNSYSLSVSRSLLPSSEGDVNQQDAYTATYRRNLTEKLTGSFTATYRLYKSADDLNSQETKYLDISPSLNWKLAQDWALIFSYKYRSIDETDGKNVDSNAIFVNIDYNWNGIRFSR